MYVCVYVQVLKKNSGGWWYVNIGDKEGWAPCSYIDRRRKAGLNRKISTLTRPKVPPPAPPPAPPIKKQSSLPCMQSEVRGCVYEEPEYDVPAVGAEFLPSEGRALHTAPCWPGEEVEEHAATAGPRHTHSACRGRHGSVWDPPEYDAPTVELSSGSQDQESEESKPKPTVRPKPANLDIGSPGPSLKPTKQQNQNRWRFSHTSSGSETDSSSSLEDSAALMLSAGAASEVTPPRLSVEAEGESGGALPQLYRSTAAFQQGAMGELDLPAGVLVEVLEKQQSGWWFVRWGGLEGWVPTYFLEPLPVGGDLDYQGGQKATWSNQNVSGVSARLQDANAGFAKGCAAATKDNNSVANDYASVAKDKNSIAKESSRLRWKDRSSSSQMSSSGRSIPVSMVKPKPQIIHNNLREEFVSMADYHGDTESMAFQTGTRLEVLEKNTNGWWYCRTLDSAHTRRGWVPSNFLEKRK